MGLILLNLNSNQQIKLDNQNPLIIGRKNIEGCFDKRVSRNHGRVTCTIDGKLRLEALHCNPCFFTRNGVPPVLQLNKDQEETLSEGDYLGLLPNAFWFKITSDKLTKITIKADNFQNISTDQGSRENKRTINLHESRSVTNSEADKTVTVKIEDSSVPNSEIKGSLSALPVGTSDSVINSTGLSKDFGSAEFEKTKRLPLWMYKIDGPMEAKKSSDKHSSPSSSDKEKKQKPLPVAETDRSSRTVVKVNGKGPDMGFPSTSNTAQVTGEVNKKPEKEQQKKAVQSDMNSLKQDAKRPICVYDEKCYRKNIGHKQRFSHPGDWDYVPLQQRSICQRESSCPLRNAKRNVEIMEHSVVQGRQFSAAGGQETALSPFPLKRSLKNTKVHNPNNDELGGGNDGNDGNAGNAGNAGNSGNSGNGEDGEDYEDYEDYDDDDEEETFEEDASDEEYEKEGDVLSTSQRKR